MAEMTLQVNISAGADNVQNNGAQFVFDAVAPVDRARSQPTADFSLFNQGSTDTSRIRFGGQQEQMRFTFALYNDGTDRSSGTGAGSTFGSTVITVAQQIQYLFDVIFDKEFDSTWTLTDNTGRFLASSVTVFVEDLRVNNPPGQVSMVTGELLVTFGRVLSLTSLFT